MIDYYSALGLWILSPNSARNISQNSVRTQPDLQLWCKVVTSKYHITINPISRAITKARQVCKLLTKIIADFRTFVVKIADLQLRTIFILVRNLHKLPFLP